MLRGWQKKLNIKKLVKITNKWSGLKNLDLAKQVSTKKNYLWQDYKTWKKENGYLKIAIANYSYLGTIAHPIRDRLIPSGLKCEFVERSFEEIGEILDLILDEKFISGDP